MGRELQTLLTHHFLGLQIPLCVASSYTHLVELLN